MNNSIAVFENAQFGQIRSIEKNGEPWFVAADVASALKYRMASDMTRRLDDDEKDTRSVRTPGGMQKMAVISESGLYSAVLGSQIPEAKEFKRWITHEVIPSIRKTGSYSIVPPTIIDYKKLPSTNHAASILMRTYKQAGANLISLASTIAAMYRGIGVPVPALEAPTETAWLTASDIAEKVGLMSTAGNPHGQAASAIIALLDVPVDRKQLMTYEKNGHSGSVMKYRPDVCDMVTDWLTDQQYPESLLLKDKTFKVNFRR